MAFTPQLAVPQRKQKGLIKLFSGVPGGMSIPFYYTAPGDAAVREGQAMKRGTLPDQITACSATEGALAMGLALQETYNEANWDPQLRGYHFANDTRQREDGSPIGLLTGSGYAVTNNYQGNVNYGDHAYIGASGYFNNSGAGGALLPVIFEGTGVNGQYVRIRFHFPLL